MHLRALLGRLAAAQRAAQPAARGLPLDHLARLLRAFGATHAGPGGRGAATSVPSMVEPLTVRELEILGLLAAGRGRFHRGCTPSGDDHGTVGPYRPPTGTRMAWEG